MFFGTYLMYSINASTLIHANDESTNRCSMAANAMHSARLSTLLMPARKVTFKSKIDRAKWNSTFWVIPVRSFLKRVQLFSVRGLVSSIKLYSISLSIDN